MLLSLWIVVLLLVTAVAVLEVRLRRLERAAGQRSAPAPAVVLSRLAERLEAAGDVTPGRERLRAVLARRAERRAKREARW